jgi:hypothetical protein
MVVNVTVRKLSGGRIGVNVSRPEYKTTARQEYDSEKEARDLLLDIGIPENALDFYFAKLFPCLAIDQELELPEMTTSRNELWWRGFRFADRSKGNGGL